MKSIITFLVVALAASTAAAQPAPPYQPGPTIREEQLGVVLNASPLNGSDLTFATNAPAGTYSKAIKGGAARGYNMLVLEMFFDYTAAAGTITTTCTVGNYTNDNGAGVCTVASTGVCAVGVQGGTFTTASLSADTRWTQRLDMAGYSGFSCTVAHGGSPGPTDTITVKATLVAE